MTFADRSEGRLRPGAVTAAGLPDLPLAFGPDDQPARTSARKASADAVSTRDDTFVA
jgi:hypothetical protein